MFRKLKFLSFYKIKMLFFMCVYKIIRNENLEYKYFFIFFEYEFYNFIF